MRIPLGKLLGLLKLADGTDGSQNFREILSGAAWPDLKEITTEAMQAKGEQAAFALQDCVNVIGQRLDFSVQFGRYRGTKEQIGHDGLWKSDAGRDFVVEVKKSGAYSIDPQKLVSYMDRLAKEGRVGQSAVGLYVVGSGESKVLDNTIKGAALANRIRVVTTDGLIGLTDLYNRTGLSHTQLVSLLSPVDSVRVDEILGIISEVLEKQEIEEEGETEPKPYAPTSSKIIGLTYAGITKTLESRLRAPPKSTATKLREWDGGRAVLFYSKDYGAGRFWFAVHPHQTEFLEQASAAFAIFACASEKDCIVWPLADLKEKLSSLNVTEDENRKFWHVHIFSKGEGKVTRWFAKGKGGLTIELNQYHNQWDPVGKLQ